ncbi:MAG: carbohydrate binding domain-containing protein, partial [Phycisphaerales bacterium]
MGKTMTRFICFAWVLTLTTTAIWAQENQIVNSEFEDGLNGWFRYGAQGFDVEVVQDAGLSGTNAVLIDVTDAAATASIGIAQPLPLGFVQGETYPVGITAKAEQEREMIILVQLYKPEVPQWLDIWTQRIELKQTPQTFVFDYEHTTETTTTNPDWEVDIYYMLKGAWWPMGGDDLSVKVWLDRLYFGAEPPLPRRDLPTNPEPADEATDVWRDADLAWTPGAFAQAHDVYLGSDFNDVNTASRADPMDLLVSQGQGAATYDAGRLAYDQTYYWRVDEVNGPPDNAVIKGPVWSFTTEPFVYPIANVVATSNALSSPTEQPVNAVDGSGLDENDLHSTTTSAMWLGSPGDDPIYIQFEFDRLYKLHEMLVWNYNAEFEMILGFGLKD